MTFRFFFLFMLLFSALPLHADQLKAFQSDGCSAFPNGTTKQKDLWLACCIEHDKYYWLGGSYEERLNADQRLQRCVARNGEPDIAMLMMLGVRLGGSPYWPSTFRWGYGWPYLRGYKSLSGQELEQVNQMILLPSFN
ncbi:MAG: hypothetical protein OEY36_07890 [Gammaproteobacteria bacterium]|nr:hypothetical protein [Gammaproteobacteria bacterium]